MLTLSAFEMLALSPSALVRAGTSTNVPERIVVLSSAERRNIHASRSSLLLVQCYCCHGIDLARLFTPLTFLPQLKVRL